MDIKAVLFDLDDTLHDDIGSFRRAAAETSSELATSITAGELTSIFLEEVESFWNSPDLAAKQLDNPRERMWSRTLARAGLDARDAASAAVRFETLRKKYITISPGVRETLMHLKESGYTLGLLTNGLRTTHREKLDILSISHYFAAIFLSDEIGYSKPDTRAFHHACAQLGSLPAQTVMVGDRYDKDIAGALQAGLRAVWLNPRAETAPVGPAPDVTITDIEQVPTALQSLAASQ